MKVYETYGLDSAQNVKHVDHVRSVLDKLISEFDVKNTLQISFDKVGFNNEYLNYLACEFLTKDKPKKGWVKLDAGYFVTKN